MNTVTASPAHQPIPEGSPECTDFRVPHTITEAVHMLRVHGNHTCRAWIAADARYRGDADDDV